MDIPRHFTGNLNFVQSIFSGVIQGSRHLGMLRHLRVYQAWTTQGTCPACGGSGAVAKVYGGDNNEPQINWAVIAGGRQVPKVTNYLFDPSRFGTSDGPGSLTPWVNSTGTGYPEPHKNLCPYCRGVGLQPGAQIRNIRRGLVSGRHPGATVSDPPLAEGDEVDLDAIPTGPESWDSAQNRIAFQHDAVVTQEAMANAVKLPASLADANLPFPMLKQLPAADQAHRFPHPLTFIALRRKWTNPLGLDPANAATMIGSGSWDCTVPCTMVKVGTEVPWELDERMGQVIFQQPIWIPCSKQFSDFLTGDPAGVRIKISGTNAGDDATTGQMATANGMPLFFSAGCGRRSDDPNGLPTGFWRPARVWMQFFYMKEHFYDALGAQTTAVIQAQTADGDPGQYYARAMIVDGRYCLEVRKAAASVQTGQVQIDASSEVLQMVISEDDAVLEIFPADFYADPVAPAPDMTDDAYAAYKEAHYAYPYGKLVLWQPPVPGEQRLSGEGYATDDFFNSTVRPRQYKWKLRDDRSRLLGKAIRALESQNTIVVTGSITVLNMQQAPGGGLGFIYYPNRGNATVKKITYNFGGRAETVLELQRELARFGEPVPSEASKMNVVTEKLTRLERLVHFKASDQAQLSGHGPQALGTTNNLMQ